MDGILGAIILLLLFGSGVYAIYTYIKLQQMWGFFDNKFLLPGNCLPEDCKDTNGYLEYIAPRLLGLGIVCTVAGILYIPVVLPNIATLLGMGDTLQSVMFYGVPPLAFAGYVWLMVCQSKAARRFWD
jgi:hypothetical protein